MRWLARLTKRLVLRSYGYTRPPFMLWVHPQRKHFWGCQRHLDPIPIPDIERGAMYLWPDRLRWHFFFAWLCFIPVFLGVQTEHGWLLAISTSVAMLVFIAVIMPFVLFDFFRAPVLSSIWKSWPAYQTNWLKGIPQLEVKGDSLFFSKYLPQITEKWDAVYWSPMGSPQESMLRAAIIDLFKRDPANEDPVSMWHGNAFRKWLIYWCSPVWTSYVVLWLLLILSVFLLKQCEITAHPKYLIASAILWTVYATVFVYRESSEIRRWASLQPDDHRFLPPHLFREINELSGLVERLTEVHVMAAFGLAQAAASGAYISIVQIFLNK